MHRLFAPAKIKRGHGHFGVLTGMWVFQNITLHRATNSAKSQAKIRLELHFVECNETLKSSFADAFSKQALESQWDRVRVICRQPFRMDKQFGLSFMRIESPPDDTIPSSPEWVSRKTATLTSGQPSDEENDEDGVMRLKKASGLMGCLR